MNLSNQNIPVQLIDKLRGTSIEFSTVSHQPVVTCQDVVRFLNVSLGRIVKCVVFKSTLGQICVAAVPGNRRVSIKKLENETETRHLKMVAPDEVPKLLGIPLGAITPVILPEDVNLVIDRRLISLDKVYLGTGDQCSSLIVSGADLLRLAGGSTADIVE